MMSLSSRIDAKVTTARVSEPSKVPILGLKSTVHFRADFQPIAETILVVQSPGAHITDPVEMPYKHLRKGVRLRPMGPVWNGA